MCAGRPYVALAPFVWLLPNPFGVYSLAANLKVSYLWKMAYTLHFTYTLLMLPKWVFQRRSGYPLFSPYTVNYYYYGSTNVWMPRVKNKSFGWAANRNHPQHRLKFVVTITQ